MVAMISLLVCSIPQKNTMNGTRIKLGSLIFMEMGESDTQPKIRGGSSKIVSKETSSERTCHGALKCSTFKGIRFKRYTAVAIASSQYLLSTCALSKRA